MNSFKYLGLFFCLIEEAWRWKLATLHNGVIVKTVLHGAETRDAILYESRKLMYYRNKAFEVWVPGVTWRNRLIKHWRCECQELRGGID